MTKSQATKHRMTNEQIPMTNELFAFGAVWPLVIGDWSFESL